MYTISIIILAAPGPGGAPGITIITNSIITISI